MRLCSCIILLVTAFYVAAPQHAPSIRFPVTTWDAGKVEQGIPIRRVFTFSNEGTRTLEITGIVHS